MNKVTLIGNVVKDPELIQTQRGIALCNFSLAINKEIGEGTTFIRICAWREKAERCVKYLHKGSRVAIIGSLDIQTYEANNGEKREKAVVNLKEIEFLSGKNLSESAGADTNARPQITPDGFSSDMSLPY